MKDVKKRMFLLPAAVLLLIVISFPVRNALAYFTDYEVVQGKADVSMKWETEIREQLTENNGQLITVRNTGSTNTVVRAQVIGSAEYTSVYAAKEEGSKWQRGNDGWWYYSEILEPGKETDEGLIAVIAADKLPEYDVQITAVHESARVLYENGSIKIPAGWQPPAEWFA